MKKIILFLMLLILITGCTVNKQIENSPRSSPQPAIPEQEISEEAQNVPLPQSEPLPSSEEEKIKNEEQKPKVAVWKEGTAAISGKYADAEIIKLDDDRYRIYYSPEPEVPGFKGQVYSALSSDGITWNQESGERMEWAIFPSVIKLPNGKYRMYFQNQGMIKSAISADGLSWNEESGVRVDASNNEGLKLENAAAPTVMKAGDEYIMVYQGTINEKYPAKVPNNNMQLFLWAVSKDGIAFEKKGIALDSRNEEFQGLLDGPELVEWSDGSVRLYFWSYKGVYHTTFNGNQFSEEPVFDFTTASDPKNRFPENPPGDSTLIEIKDKWFLYYGQHKEGIFYAVLEDMAR